jgi:uncharacterized protein
MSFNAYLPDTVAELVEQLKLIPHPEGGFFLETYRSGCEPMSSRGQTDLNVETHYLVAVTGRDHCRPDHSNKRNCITSIYWVPTVKSPTLPLTANLSDHVHYYQGGQAFQYFIYDPSTSTVRTVVLGPDLKAGHQLQVPVVSGEWKCGRLLTDACSDKITADYCIVAEAVGPGFDFHDFHWVQDKELAASHPSEQVMALLKPFLYQPAITTKEEEFGGHYDENATKQSRTKERM